LRRVTVVLADSGRVSELLQEESNHADNFFGKSAKNKKPRPKMVGGVFSYKNSQVNAKN
jgi:hypothetical protein